MPIYVKNDKRILHVHIPKCGGTSITMLAIQQGFAVEKFMTNFPGFPDYLRPDGTICLQHATSHVYRHWDYTESFTVVREPVDRMQSELAQWGISPADAHDWIAARFLMHKTLTTGSTIDDLEAMQMIGWPAVNGMHTWPQTDFVDADCRWLRYGEENDLLQELFGTSIRPLLRQAPNPKYKLEARTIALIQEFYAADYERFYPVYSTSLCPVGIAAEEIKSGQAVCLGADGKIHGFKKGRPGGWAVEET